MVHWPVGTLGAPDEPRRHRQLVRCHARSLNRSRFFFISCLVSGCCAQFLQPALRRCCYWTRSPQAGTPQTYWCSCCGHSVGARLRRECALVRFGCLSLASRPATDQLRSAGPVFSAVPHRLAFYYRSVAEFCSVDCKYFVTIVV